MCIWKTHRIKINLESQRKYIYCMYICENSLHMIFLVTVRCIFILDHVTLRRFNTIGTIVLLPKPMMYF